MHWLRASSCARCCVRSSSSSFSRSCRSTSCTWRANCFACTQHYRPYVAPVAAPSCICFCAASVYPAVTRAPKRRPGRWLMLLCKPWSTVQAQHLQARGSALDGLPGDFGWGDKSGGFRRRGGTGEPQHLLPISKPRLRGCFQTELAALRVIAAGQVVRRRIGAHCDPVGCWVSRHMTLFADDKLFHH